MKSLKRPQPGSSNASRESNARNGYCAPALFARATDIPDVVSDSLPRDMYCTVNDMIAAVKKVERQLHNLNPTAGDSMVLVNADAARDLVLTLVLLNTAIGLDKSLDPAPVIAEDHHVLRSMVEKIRALLIAVKDGKMSYEDVMGELEKLPNPALAFRLISLAGQKHPVVHSLAGPIDLAMEKLNIKDAHSAKVHTLRAVVSGGYDDRSGLVSLKILALVDADPRLLVVNDYIQAQVVDDAQRVNLLLSQLAKRQVQVSVQIPRAPFFVNVSSKINLHCDLSGDVEICDEPASLSELKAAFTHQQNLEFNLEASLENRPELQPKRT